MNQIKNFLLGLDFKTLIIIGLVILLLLTRMCSSSPQTSSPVVKVNGKKYEQVQHKVDTVIVTKNTIVYRPGKTIYKQSLKYITPPNNIKKDSIIKNYYNIVVYKDTIKLKDNQGYVSVTDTITQNKIIGRLWKSHIVNQIIHDNNIIKELPKSQIYVGGILGGDKVNPINYIGPALLLKTKQNHIYTISAGYGNNKTLSLQGGIFWKIKLGE